MNRYQKFFSDPEKAAKSLLSMKCLSEDFTECDGCPFWDFGRLADPCPQYEIGTKAGAQIMKDWLEMEL